MQAVFPKPIGGISVEAMAAALDAVEEDEEPSSKKQKTGGDDDDDDDGTIGDAIDCFNENNAASLVGYLEH